MDSNTWNLDRVKACEESLKLLLSIFEKIHEDILEAYRRTPVTVSSRPYAERAFRLSLAGITIVKNLLKKNQ